MYALTQNGRREVKRYLSELAAKRKEILDAGIDTADDTNLPTEKDILCDIETFIDEDGRYYNGWGVTDHYDADQPLSLIFGVDFVEKEAA